MRLLAVRVCPLNHQVWSTELTPKGSHRHTSLLSIYPANLISPLCLLRSLTNVARCLVEAIRSLAAKEEEGFTQAEESALLNQFLTRLQRDTGDIPSQGAQSSPKGS